MALSAAQKSNIENLKHLIETLQRDIEAYNRTIKANNARTGSKSTGDHAKIQKKYAQEKIKGYRAQIASIRKQGS